MNKLRIEIQLWDLQSQLEFFGSADHCEVMPDENSINIANSISDSAHHHLSTIPIGLKVDEGDSLIADDVVCYEIRLVASMSQVISGPNLKKGTGLIDFEIP